MISRYSTWLGVQARREMVGLGGPTYKKKRDAVLADHVTQAASLYVEETGKLPVLREGP